MYIIAAAKVVLIVLSAIRKLTPFYLKSCFKKILREAFDSHSITISLRIATETRLGMLFKPDLFFSDEVIVKYQRSINNAQAFSCCKNDNNIIIIL